MTITVNDIIRVAAVVTVLGQEFVNVHHLKVLSNTTANDAAAMAELVATLGTVYNNIQPDQSDTLQYLRIEGQNITQDEVLPTTAWPGLPFGGEVLPILPTQVAPYVYWPTARLRTRASSYLPGYTEGSNTTGGQWDLGTIANLQLFGDALVPAIASANLTTQKGAYNRALDRYIPLSSAVVQPRSRTQRRRRVGVGV